MTWSRLVPNCPVCGLGLERGEQGYWLGAYFFNLMAVETLFGVWVVALLWWTWPSPPWSFFQIGTIVLMAVVAVRLLSVLQDALPGVRSLGAAADRGGLHRAARRPPARPATAPT